MIFKRYSFRTFRFVICVAFAYAGGMHALSAEEVLLRSGETISGRVTGHTPAGIQLVTAKGPRTIARADLVKIQYVQFTPVEKEAAREAARKKREAEAAAFERVRRARIEEADRQRKLVELEAQVRIEREKEARERADRAAALRDLVEKGQMEKPVGEPISFRDFAWRSALFPGWGHFYIDRPVMGTVYSGATIGFVAAVYDTHRRALAATRENHWQVEQNFLFTLYPGLATVDQRVAYSYYSNARAFLTYRHKIDVYNGALLSLATLYGVQLLHMIYNGIAWENGLLIVSNEPEQAGVSPLFAVLPETEPGNDRKVRNGFVLGIKVTF
ncbi:MAG: hypothetical protein HY042_00005 [Spirochaetia bacterium]|nr:hypothetical protein [Spirochaetia bacterium]